jgi:hypothetical protein
MVVACVLALGLSAAEAQEVLTVNKIDTPPTTDLEISPTSGYLNIGGHLLPTLTDTYDFGSPNKLWNQGYLAQLNAILFALNTQTLMGGYSTWSVNAGSFAAAVSSGDTTINFGTTMTPGHFVLTRAHDTGGTITAEYFQVGSLVSGTTYNVTRNLSGLGAKNWAQGVPFVVLGTTGTGRMDVLAYDGKPRLQVVEQGATYNAQTPRLVLGNLNGYYGYSSDINGLAVGVTGGARLLVEPTNGIQIYGSDNDPKVTIDAVGNAIFDGYVTVGTGRNMIRNSDCTVATTDWNIFTNTGLTTQLLGPWPGVGDWGLGGYPNDCYIAVTGTPSAGAVSSAFGGGLVGGAGFNGISVLADQRYEASAYIGVHRSGDTYALIQWFNSSATLISSSNGNVCTAAKAGGATLSGYCRSGVVATAPTGAVAARLVVQTTHTAELDPFIFMAHMYFGEAAPAQEDLTPWGAAGTTAINNGLIETDAINARTIAADSITTSELAADSVTSAKIVAMTIVASDIASETITATQIAANTITAANLNVSTLSSISGNMGTLTAGSITGGTIDGATVRAGSGDEVTLDSSGITISGGTGTNNRIKWTGGHEMWGTTGGIFVSTSFSIEDVLVVGGEGSSALDLTVPDLGVADQIQFVNMPSSTGTTVIWENSCGCLKKDSSSLRYKDNVHAWRPADASALLRATPITYDFRNGGEQGVLGLSAEDVYAVAPSVVNLDAEGRPDSIRQGAFNAYLLQIIKDLRAEIDALKSERQR